MRPTRRGWGVAVVVAFCLVMAWEYGARSLNALVAPLVVVALAAVVSVALVEKPTVWRRPVEEGFVGDVRSVELEVEVDSPTTATIEDRVGDGLSSSGNAVETTLRPGTPVSYEVELESRGERTVGPVTIAVRDVLGLAERRFEYRATESVLVYPRVYDLRGGTRHDLQLLADAVREYTREEFDHLREYERGDALRDVHWKSTAKRPDHDLVVKEFVADEEVGSVEIAAESDPRHDDEMAVAAASVATYLLERGVSVGVAAPNEARDPDVGRTHHRELLRALARAESGTVPEGVRTRADVLIRADVHGAAVVVDGHEIPFERLTSADVRRTITGGDRSPTRRRGVVA